MNKETKETGKSTATCIPKYEKTHEQKTYLSIIGYGQKEIYSNIPGKELPKYISENLKKIDSGEIKLFEMSAIPENTLRFFEKNPTVNVLFTEYLLKSTIKNEDAKDNPSVTVSGLELYSRMSQAGLNRFIDATETFELKMLKLNALEKIIKESNIIDDPNV